MPKLEGVTHQLIATREKSYSLCTEKLGDDETPLGKIFMEKYLCLIILNHEVELQ